MGLMQLNEMGWNKIETAIEVIKQNEPPEGYYVANSGGKDSGIIVDLCKKAGVKFDAHYNVSPIDPPEVYKFLKEYHPETQWEYFARGFWNEYFPKFGLPNRRKRWCCKVIKECGGSGRLVITGIRWAESTKRKSRCQIEVSRQDSTKRFLHSIICWSDVEVWEYYRMFKLPYLSLYDNGWERVGCIGCPQATPTQRQFQFIHYPKIAQNWRNAADKYFVKHLSNKYLAQLSTTDNYWNWWLSGKSVKNYLNEHQSKF
jgi:phosphoadenosine phosphosulfate reductase